LTSRQASTSAAHLEIIPPNYECCDPESKAGFFSADGTLPCCGKENAERPTLNAQHRMQKSAPLNLAFDVGRWMFAPVTCRIEEEADQTI